MYLPPGRGRAALVALAFVVPACLAYVVSTLPGVRSVAGYSHMWEVGFFNLVVSGSALVVLLRAATTREARLPWALLSLGMASYAAGTLHFSLYLQPLPEMPYPSLSDALWLAFYPLAASSLVLLARQDQLRRRGAGPQAGTLLDGLIAGASIAGISAAFAFDRIIEGASGHVLAVATNIAYPVADLALLALVASVLVVLGRAAGTVWWVLGAGFVAFAAADTVFLLQVAAEAYQPGSPVDATWAVAVTLVAIAARPRPARAEEPGASPPLSTVLLPAACGAASAAVLALGTAVTVSPLGVALSTIALIGVFIRMMLALRQALNLAESRRQARTDELTGLPNRRWFYEVLESAGRGEEPLPPAHLLLLDLDQFKEVNDALGHNTGDHLLRQVAQRLDGASRPHRLARLGGDEFAVLVTGSLDEATHLATQILDVIRQPYDVELMVLHVDCSVGVAELDPRDPGRSLACADIAMYRAKSVRGGIEVYESAEDNSWDRLNRIEALRAGIHSGQLELDYQPILHLTSNQVHSLEALVRWRHPTRGRVAPDDFLPLAEQTGLMHAVTMRVLELALDQAVRLEASGHRLSVTVNLSASDLLDSSLTAAITQGLAERGLASDALRIEITETLLVTDRTRSDPTLSHLKEAGIQLSVDDYGTGYSSLAYLHDLPVSELKIDQIFVQRLLADRRTATIVRSTIALAHDLGLAVVGEGVETEQQLAWLRAAGADAAQGWLVARPMSADAVMAWLADHDQVSALAAAPHVPVEPG